MKQTVEEAQPFEKYENLRNILLFAANTWQVDLSNWSALLAEINQLCLKVGAASLPSSSMQCLIDLKLLIQKYNKELPNETCKCSNHVYNEIQSILIKNKI